jgi:hypothetical protein
MSSKPGVPYREICDQIQTFDLILFRGGDFVSGAISRVESVTTGVDDFTHVGIAIRAQSISELSDLWRPGNDTLYIFESTASGKLVDGVSAVTDGRGHLGAQVRDMAQVAKHYDAGATTRMAWMPLQDSIRAKIDPRAINAILDKYMYTAYNASCVSLAAAASPILRKIRDSWVFRKIRSILYRYFCCGAQPNTWLFCSELCAHIYRDIGVFPDSVIPADVMPVDFLPEETTPFLVPAATSSAEEEKPPKASDRMTVDVDHQVPWVFGTLVRFHADPPKSINTVDDLVKHPGSSPL